MVKAVANAAPIIPKYLIKIKFKVMFAITEINEIRLWTLSRPVIINIRPTAPVDKLTN